MSGSVVVTGSSGRIGHALARQLAASGYEVVGIDLRPGAHTTDVADLAVDDLAPLIEGCTAIVHCAALHAPHVGVASTSDFIEANVTATERLAAAALLVGVRRLVFTSSTSVYGHSLVDPDRAVWVDENLPVRPRDIYDETKREAEHVVARSHDDSLSTITVRVARCFPEESRTAVINRLYRGVDIRDVVTGLMAAVDAVSPAHRIINLAGPRVFQRVDAERLRHDAASVIRSELPSLVADFEIRRWALPDSIDRIYVSDLARSTLGWNPLHGVRSALSSNPATS